jgi:hypothetical protein
MIKACKNCRWAGKKQLFIMKYRTMICKNIKNVGWRVEPQNETDYTTGTTKYNNGEYMTCNVARLEHQSCGKEGKHFEAYDSIISKIKSYGGTFIIIEIIILIEAIFVLNMFL